MSHLKLIHGQPNSYSEDYHKGMSEGRRRIAGVTAHPRSYDEMAGLLSCFIMVIEFVLKPELKKLEAQKKRFKPRLVYSADRNK